jgi:outer membrane assembly lipoprotein YfgL
VKPRVLPKLPRLALAAVASAAFLALAACSSPAVKPEPAPLTAFSPALPAKLLWKAQVGAQAPLLAPALSGRQLALASAAGIVTVLEAHSGREVWRTDLRTPLAVGVGFDGDIAAVITASNELVAISGGKEQWRVRLPARVFTTPLVAGKRVFVLAGDRSVSAYDGSSGARLWSQAARGTDALVLQQGGVILAVGDTLLAGIGGRLAGLSPTNGSTRWEVPVATPRGVNEIERLVDLVGPVGRVEGQVCVRAFQSAVGCIDARRGALSWTRPANGGVGLAADEEQVYGVESDGRVRAWKGGSGEPAWQTDLLLHRGLTAPTVVGRAIALGDASGHVHLLSGADGKLLNRLPTDGSAILAAPVMAGANLLALTRNGVLYAWRPE